MGRLDNKIALVTGGNSGIGLAIARKFTQEGAKVIITARRKTELEQALLSIGGKTIAIPADLTSAKDRTRIIEEINARYGRLDIFIANAGRSEIQVMTEVTELNYDALFNLNAKAAFFSLQDALPLMGNGGSIVLVASIAHFKGTPNLSIYSASKAALRSFARTLTSELAERGIRVNVISPGVILTPAFDAVPEAMTQALIAQAPLKRLGRVEEVAAAALFLASEESSYITGIDLCVDGGMGQV